MRGAGQAAAELRVRMAPGLGAAFVCKKQLSLDAERF
jgi:hypothetical protein